MSQSRSKSDATASRFPLARTVMKQFICRSIPVAIVVALVATVVAKDSNTKQGTRPIDRDVKTLVHVERHVPDALPLGKTIRLNFRIKEEETQRFTVTTATTEYATGFNYTGSGSSSAVNISGRIRFIDDKQKKMLVTASFDLRYDDEEGVYDANGKTSAMIGFDSEVELLQQETFTLTVEAELVD